MSRFVKITQAGSRLDPPVTTQTLRNHVAKGYYPAYRATGIRGILVDLDEVEAAMRRMPRSKTHLSKDAYGPNARIKNLPVIPEVVTPATDGGETR